MRTFRSASEAALTRQFEDGGRAASFAVMSPERRSASESDSGVSRGGWFSGVAVLPSSSIW